MRYIVQKAPNVSGDPIPADEPCLVIRAQDVLAEFMLSEYIKLATLICVPDDVLNELYHHRTILRSWRLNNPSKLKVADR